MSAVVGALRAVLSLESAAFTSGLKQAQSGLAGFASSAKKMGSTLQKIGAVMSIAGVGMAAGIRSQLNLADDMSKAAQKFGVPIEQLSALKYAADLSGVSLDTLGTGLRKLSQNMDSASRGNKVATDLRCDWRIAARCRCDGGHIRGNGSNAGWGRKDCACHGTVRQVWYRDDPALECRQGWLARHDGRSGATWHRDQREDRKGGGRIQRQHRKASSHSWPPNWPRRWSRSAMPLSSLRKALDSFRQRCAVFWHMLRLHW